jgi:hypothetical protein
VFTTISPAEKSLLLANCSFAKVFATPKLAEFRHLRRIAGKEQCYGSPKNRLFEENHLAMAGCQSTGILGKANPHVGHAWRRMSLLVAATVISSKLLSLRII